MTIFGLAIVMMSVFGGFILHGGHFLILIQPTEFLIIGGTIIGSVLIACPFYLILRMLKRISQSFRSHGSGKKEYLQVLMALHEIFRYSKVNPLDLEPHIENPKNSYIFKKSPYLAKNKELIDFTCDTLKIIISSSTITWHELEGLMDVDLESKIKEEKQVPIHLFKVADALPGIGIVAAVLGVIITMGKLTSAKSAIGESIAVALIGTFLGIFLSYGVVQPIASKIESRIEDDETVFKVIKSGLLAMAKGCIPSVSVEFARRTVPPHSRPSFTQIESMIQSKDKNNQFRM